MLDGVFWRCDFVTTKVSGLIRRAMVFIKKKLKCMTYSRLFIRSVSFRVAEY